MLSHFLRTIGGASTPPATNPPFNLVSLLLHGDGTNGAQNNTFVDGSSNNFTITRTGNVAQGTFSPFSLAEGQWSANLDGSSYFTVTDATAFDMSGDFTVEFWLNPRQLNQENTATVFCCGNTSLFQFNTLASGSKLEWYANRNPAIISVSYVGYLNLNQWNHLAAVRTGSTLSLYVNGTRLGTTTNNTSYDLSQLYIGRQPTSGHRIDGYLSNFRVIKGSGPYDATQSSLTVPTGALTAITNTVLLTCQSNRFVDNSSNNFTITLSGTPKVTAFSPFAPSAAYDASTNGGSGYFDGSGDYLSVANNSSLLPLTGDFTFECWVYTLALTRRIVGFGGFATAGNFQVEINGSGNILVHINGTNTTYTNPYNLLGTWRHIAVSRQSGSVKVFVDGNQIGSTTTQAGTINTTDVMYIGAQIQTTIQSFFFGYLVNFRWVVGSALYTVNFTPPTAPLTAITNTQLLLNCVNAGIYDNAAKNDIETVGNAQVNTSVKKYGTGAMSFNGTTDYLNLPISSELSFGTGDFTVEAWIYINDLASQRTFIHGMLSNSGNFGCDFRSNSVVAYTVGGASVTWPGVTASTGVWQHHAFVRSGSTLTWYKDGISQGGKTFTNNVVLTGGMRIGATNLPASYMSGYIDDLRITKGVALYTTNFIPPTQAFPNQ